MLRQARQESLFRVLPTGRDSTRPRPNGRFFRTYPRNGPDSVGSYTLFHVPGTSQDGSRLSPEPFFHIPEALFTELRCRIFKNLHHSSLPAMSHPIHLDLTMEDTVPSSGLHPIASDPNPRPSIEEWGETYPNCVIFALRSIVDPMKQPNGRAYFKSYPDWENQTPDQMNKSVAYFRSLKPEVQAEVLAVARSKDIYDKSKTKERRDHTTKDDKVHYFLTSYL